MGLRPALAPHRQRGLGLSESPLLLASLTTVPRCRVPLRSRPAGLMRSSRAPLRRSPQPSSSRSPQPPSAPPGPSSQPPAGLLLATPAPSRDLLPHNGASALARLA